MSDSSKPFTTAVSLTRRRLLGASALALTGLAARPGTAATANSLRSVERVTMRGSSTGQRLKQG